MPERKKLELELNKPVSLELLFDEPKIGQSQYGEYYLYAVRNGGPDELSFFATEDVHEKLSTMNKGDRFTITKIAEQKGSKIFTRYEVTQQLNPSPPPIQQSDNYYELMLSSCRDAIKIQQELGGLMDAKSLAVTLFIARSKTNGYS